MAEIDPVLQRAKLLVEASKEISNMTSNISASVVGGCSDVHIAAVSPKRKSSNNNNNNNQLSNPPSPTKMPPGVMTFRAAVINGSSLVNTQDDIREYVKRGDSIIIDGTAYTTSVNGAWAGNCIQLVGDYTGNTNFEGIVQLADPTAGKIAVPKKKKHVAVPVDTESILAAVGGLGDMRNTFGASGSSGSHNHFGSSSNSNGLDSPSKQKIKKRLPRHVEALSDNYSTSYERSTSSRPSSHQQHSQHSNQQHSRQPPQQTYNKRPTPPTSAQTSSRVQSAPRRQQQQQQQQHTVEQDGVVLVPSAVASANYLVEGPVPVDPKKVAMQRVQAKLKEEQRQIALAEQEKDRLAALKAEKMAAKAQALKLKTQERVAKYKQAAIDREAAEKARKELEAEEKKKREEEVHSELTKKKLIAMKKDTARKLRKLKESDYERAVAEEAARAEKLNQISKKMAPPPSYLPSVMDVHQSAVDTNVVLAPTSSYSAGAAAAAGSPVVYGIYENEDDESAGIVRAQQYSPAKKKLIEHQKQQEQQQQQQQQQGSGMLPPLRSKSQDGARSQNSSQRLPDINNSGQYHYQQQQPLQRYMAAAPPDEDEWSDDDLDAAHQKQARARGEDPWEHQMDEDSIEMDRRTFDIGRQAPDQAKYKALTETDRRMFDAMKARGGDPYQKTKHTPADLDSVGSDLTPEQPVIYKVKKSPIRRGVAVEGGQQQPSEVRFGGTKKSAALPPQHRGSGAAGDAQQYHQYSYHSQQQRSTAMSPTKSSAVTNHNSPNSKTNARVWGKLKQKLKPIPIAPYQPPPSVG